MDDGLHLSAEGYALWDSVLRPAVDAVLEPLAPVDEPPEGSPPTGARVLIDVGPNNPGDGEVTPSPDYLGQHWNNWHDLDGGGQVLPGEHLDALRTTDGTPTPIGLVVTGGFEANGWANGGLRWPDQTLLGDLAVGSATGDFWYASGADQPGGWMFQGLDPGRRYTLRLFASRDDAELRITRFTAVGAGQPQSAVVQTSGVGAGQMDATTANNDDVAVLEALQADRWGHLFVDVEVVQGRYAYTSLIELHVQ
ncbi:MAG: hypothetical protein AAFS10_07360 [Myxococcota bacterium]